MPSLEGLQPHLESATPGTEDRGGGTAQKAPARVEASGNPVGSGPPGLHAAAPVGGAHASHTRCVEEQAGPSKPLFRPGVNLELSQDQEVRHQQRSHPLQPRPPQSRSERHWKQHRTSGPAGVGRPPQRPTGLRPDEPPVSTAPCLLRRSGRWALGRSSKEAGGQGGQREGRSFHAQRWSASSEQSDSLPAGSTSPQCPLPSTTEGSCLYFPGEDAPSTEGGPAIAKSAAQVPGGWSESHGSEGTRGSCSGWPRPPGLREQRGGHGPVYLPLLVPRALGGPRTAHGLGLRAVYELQQVLHPAMVDHTLPFRELVCLLGLLFLPLGQP